MAVTQPQCVDSNDAWLPRVGSAQEERSSVLGLEERPCLFPESLMARLGPGLPCASEGGETCSLPEEATEGDGMGGNLGGTWGLGPFPCHPPCMFASAHHFLGGPVVQRKECQAQGT